MHRRRTVLLDKLWNCILHPKPDDMMSAKNHQRRKRGRWSSKTDLLEKLSFSVATISLIWLVPSCYVACCWWAVLQPLWVADKGSSWPPLWQPAGNPSICFVSSLRMQAPFSVTNSAVDVIIVGYQVCLSILQTVASGHSYNP